MGNTGHNSSVNEEPGCPFCAIVQLSDPDVREIYRDDRTVAFFPTEPAAPGHTLIIPHAHVPHIWELKNGDSQRIGVLISRISHVIMNTVEAEGLNVIQSNGEVATQSVNHVHVHLVPRWTGDSIGNIWPSETHYSEQAKDSIWKVLREACGGLQL